MKFTYAATARDRYRVIRAITSRQLGWKLVIGGMWAILVAFGIGGLALGRPLLPLLFELLPYAILLVVWTALLPALWYVVARVALRSAAAHGDHTIELTDGGLRESGQVTATTVQWNGIVRVVETTEFFLFYYTRNSVFYLPRSAVPTTDLGAVRAFIGAHVPPDRMEVA